MFEGEKFNYRCILTSDHEKTEKEVIEFYNQTAFLLKYQIPMPVRFIFHDIPDTLHVSRSGGWYEVEIYPIDTNAQAIKIPAPFTFPAKIEMRFTTFLEWVKGRR